MHILLNVKNSGSWFNKFILKQCTWKSKAGRIKPVMLSSNFLSRWKCCEDTIAGILCCCSVTQLCPTLHTPMDCSTPGFPVLHHLLELCSNSCPLSWGCHPAGSSSVVPFSSCLQSFPASGSFLKSQLFTSGGQSIGASASASVLHQTLHKTTQNTP